MSTLEHAPQGGDESREFLQQRVAGFGRQLAGFVFGFFLFSNGVASLDSHTKLSLWWEPQNLLVLGAGTIPLLVWWACRAGERQIGELESIDTIATIATGTCIGLTTIYNPPVQRPELGAVMGLAIFLILRAIVVPSTGMRTLVLSAITSLPAIYAAWENHAAEPPAPYKLPLFLYPALTAVWAALGVTVAATASRTIFGLRRRVSEAAKLGQYTLGEKIGEGGMGAVYRASHAMMKRDVAIKLLPPGKGGSDALLRFEREVQLTSRLNSPNTIAIFDYGRTPDGVFYYVMEYLDGFSLEDLVVTFGPLSPGRVVRIATQICGALAEAHSIGLIHRDIKPANIVLCERAGVRDVVKVLDFGLVKELGGGASATTDSALTGTPLYLAPEAIKTPDAVDGRSDLYAVGAVAFYLLTGTHVFEGSTIVEVCSHHLHTKPDTPSARLGQPIPRDVEAIVMRCLAKSPSDRFPDARSLRDALLACDSADDWTDELAKEWWRANGDRAAHSRPHYASSSEVRHTVAIDLEHRDDLTKAS